MKINPIPRFLPRTILPCAFDESMSYYEMLCALLYKQGEIIKKLNEHDTKISEITTKINNLTDQIFHILQRLSNLETRLNNLDLNAELINPITNNTDTIQNILNMITSKLCNCDNPPITPSTNSISASEFDSMIINVSVYDSLEISANDFDSNSKNILENYINLESEGV